MKPFDKTQLTIKHYPKMFKNNLNLNVNGLETQICYKNVCVTRIFSEEVLNNALEIHVETNSKVIKRFNLPYRKTKVLKTNKKYDKIKLYTSKQLLLGVSYVMTVLKLILTEYKTLYNKEYSRIITERSNGIAGRNNDEYRRVSILLKKINNRLYV